MLNHHNLCGGMLCSPVIMLFILGTSSYQCDVWDAEESSGPGGLSTSSPHCSEKSHPDFLPTFDESDCETQTELIIQSL